jgi:hypothetical protein
VAYRFGLDDVGYLSSAAGRDALAVAAGRPLTDQSLLADLTALRGTAGGYAGAVAETVRLRRRAEARWGPGYADWLFTDEALQQAAPPEVATHRARRLAGVRVHDLTCSIGGDLAALARPPAAAAVAEPAAGRSAAAGPGRPPGTSPIGSDLDPVRLAMARHNLAVTGLDALLLRADARTVTSRGTIRYADPARRDATGRRITSTGTIPSVAELDAADPSRLPVLRLPPGIDYPGLDRPGEIEIVSLDGVVREAVAWPPPLATVARRATVLRTRAGAGAGTEAASGFAGSPAAGYQLTSDDPDDAPVGAVGDWIVDPDPAVVRAHLVRHYAARHGLALLDGHLAYLTGPAPPPGVRAFRVLDAATYRERVVRDWVVRDGVGTLEIKQRGTPVIPDELRARIRPSGDRRVQRTLIVARIGTGVQAFWCQALAAPDPAGAPSSRPPRGGTGALA